MHAAWKPLPVTNAPEGVVLFDGVCVLCSWWVRFVIARDPQASFRFLAVQSPAGRDLAKQLGIDADEPETNAVILGGYAYFKADAALHILARLPGYGWINAGALLPSFLRNWIYDRIARNRYEWFGRRATCLNPNDEQIRRHFVA